MKETTRVMVGIVALVGYVLTIPFANLMVEHVGTTCIPQGPCVVPVWPGVLAPSGSLMIGLALVLRDVVQRSLGLRAGLMAILIGAGVSWGLSAPALVMASVTSFLFSELADFGVYTPLQRNRFVLAVFASGCVGLVVDGMIFLSIAFGSLALLPGIVLIKLYMVLAALPVMVWLRKRVPVAA